MEALVDKSNEVTQSHKADNQRTHVTDGCNLCVDQIYVVPGANGILEVLQIEFSVLSMPLVLSAVAVGAVSLHQGVH